VSLCFVALLVLEHPALKYVNAVGQPRGQHCNLRTPNYTDIAQGRGGCGYRDSEGLPPLQQYASYFGHLDIVPHRLDHGADLSFRDNGPERPLDLAAFSQYSTLFAYCSGDQHPHCAQVVLEHNVDVDPQSKDGRAPLYSLQH